MSDDKNLKTHYRKVEVIDAGADRLHRTLGCYLDLDPGEVAVSYRQTNTGFDIMPGAVQHWVIWKAAESLRLIALMICVRLGELTVDEKIQMMVSDGCTHVDAGDRELIGWRATLKPIHGKPGEYGLHITPAWV